MTNWPYPSEDQFEIFPQTNFAFVIQTKLVERAEDRTKNKDAFPGDLWKVKIRGQRFVAADDFLAAGKGIKKLSFIEGREIPEYETDFTTGTGCRGNSGFPGRPSAKTVLICLSSDFATAKDLPGGDIEAMEYVQSEFEYKTISDCARVVRSLREGMRGLTPLLRYAGITNDQFAEWRQELDQ